MMGPEWLRRNWPVFDRNMKTYLFTEAPITGIEEQAAGGIGWGVRESLPLVETRVAFHLPQMEMDNVARGCADADLQPLQDVVARAAQFEDNAVFNGFAGGGIDGIVEAAAHKPGKLPKSADAYPGAVAAEESDLTRTRGDAGYPRASARGRFGNG